MCDIKIIDDIHRKYSFYNVITNNGCQEVQNGKRDKPAIFFVRTVHHKVSITT